ncbi:MAG: excinuclease ABC subunit UvrC [Clostridia bacterium]
MKLCEFAKQKLETITTEPGVYIMRNESGQVIYVGKAKNLKKRVTQYFSNSKKLFKVQAMVEKIVDFDFFITLSEFDALALESNLIKKYQPFYNILLKDGKASPYIKIDLKEPFPRLEVVRRVTSDGARYFGPYFAGVNVWEIMAVIESAFPLRTCKLALGEKKAKRECLNFLLGKCLAPCTGRISAEDYKKIIFNVIDFLNGNDSLVTKTLEEKMQKASETENFEMAILIRERLRMLNRIKSKVVAQLPKDISLDIFACESNSLSTAICVVSVRGGKILGIQNFNLLDASLEKHEALSSFLLQFYELNVVPSEVVIGEEKLSTEPISKFLFEKAGKQVNFHVAKNGIKKSLLNLAEKNAKDHLEKSITKERSKWAKTIGAMERLKDAMNLEEVPKRIECFDISNTSGVMKVASMVVFENGEPKKKDYRKFKISSIEGPNDFASIAEAVRRRLKNLNSNMASFSTKPNLILIDGGKGQLTSATHELEASGTTGIALASLAKQFEEVFVGKEQKLVMLRRGSVELLLLQKIRDEAHRFAITFHRQLRAKNMLKSPLDDINGIGPAKKDALLKIFGTSEKVFSASIDELVAVKGITQNLAQEIVKHKTSD